MKKISNKIQGFSSTIVLLVVLVILGGIAVYYLTLGNSLKTSESSEVNISPKEIVSAAVLPSPSPFLFQELTIPYLRNKEYNSMLGELERYTDNGTYTSYVTSYSSDGLKINGLLTQPKGEEPEGGWPAIIFIHGYIPPTSYRTTEKYVDHVNYLARNGFVVFKIDLRGHGNSEGEASGAYYSSDYIIDVLNARAALQRSDFVNPDKIGLWGHSMAGNVILRTLAVKGEIPAASIWGGAVYTYLDMTELGIQDGSYQPPSNQTERQKRRQLLRDTYGDPPGGNPFWDEVIATNYLGDMKGAIQLNHAVNDDVVSVEYSRVLNKLLDLTSIPHELKEYPGGGHNISNPGFTPAMQNTVEFFSKYLKN